MVVEAQELILTLQEHLLQMEQLIQVEELEDQQDILVLVIHLVVMEDQE